MKIALSFPQIKLLFLVLAILTALAVAWGNYEGVMAEKRQNEAKLILLSVMNAQEQYYRETTSIPTTSLD